MATVASPYSPPTVGAKRKMGQRRVHNYFAFVEGSSHFTPFLAMRMLGPFDFKIFTVEMQDNASTDTLDELLCCMYCLINKEDDVFIGKDADDPDGEIIDRDKFNMRVIRKYGFQKIDKTTLAEACLKGHPVALLLRPFLLEG